MAYRITFSDGREHLVGKASAKRFAKREDFRQVGPKAYRQIALIATIQNYVLKHDYPLPPAEVPGVIFKPPTGRRKYVLGMEEVES